MEKLSVIRQKMDTTLQRILEELDKQLKHERKCYQNIVEYLLDTHQEKGKN